MSKHKQDGGVIAILIISLLIIMLGGALAYGYWANNGREDYKNNVDAKIAAAVATAKQQQNATDNAQFAQEAKNPLRAYDGPEAYGSLVVWYPKTWSAYVDDSGNGSSLVNGYFAPNTVPSISAQGSIFALRVQLNSQTYSQSIQNIAGGEQSGTISSAVAYALPKEPKVIGLKVVGQLPDGSTGTMVLLPLRSETLQIWTNGTANLGDFNNIILPNFSFSP